MTFVTLFFIIIAAVVIAVVIGYLISGPSYDGPPSDHFNGKVFLNPSRVESKGFVDLVKWLTSRQQGEWTDQTARPPGSAETPPARVHEGTRITFINHATFLIQTAGLNILTDPVWSERVSPFSWIGPKRMKHAGLEMSQLPAIDAIVISHNHYDHLDVTTLKTLHEKHRPKIIVPLGVDKLLTENDIPGSIAMGWWEDMALGTATLRSVPAQHFSGRGTFDRNTTLWCGYVIDHAEGNIFFAGDTGYHQETFTEIEQRTGPFKLALLPIGAYQPYWFMSPIHTSPDDAVKLHLDIKANLSIGMHYGTFPLADDGEADPLLDLAKAMAKHGVPDDEFITLEEGEHLMLSR